MPPPRAHTAIDIDAPLALTWATMLDLPRYPEWNPFIVHAQGVGADPRPGQRMVLRVRWKNGRETLSPEEIHRVEHPAPREDGVVTATLAYVFRGALDRFGLVRGTRVQTLEQRADGKVRYSTHEDFFGALAFAVPLRDVQDGFVRNAKALAARVASEHARQGARP
jgi:hypothetical protein